MRNIMDREAYSEHVPKARPELTAVASKGLKGIVAGGITGAIEICITYPTEFVKTQMQLEVKGQNKYNGYFDCIYKTINERGVFGLYRGLGVLVIGSVPKSATRFGGFEILRGYFANENNQLSNKNKLLCGLGAGVFEAVLIVTPMETIKVKLIHDQRSEKPKYSGLLHGVKSIIAAEGISGIYKGLSATILKQGSNQAMRFFCMETFKDKYKGGDSQKVVPKYLVGIFGFVAGAVSVLGNTPLDVIKTRLQGLEASKYKSTLDCAIQILTNEGPTAFFKGLLPRLGRVCMNVAISFMIYDAFMVYFNKVWP